MSKGERNKMVIAMEEYIEEHAITEIRRFTETIRYDQPEWYNLLTKQMTMYFKAFISSNRRELREAMRKRNAPPQ